MVVDFTERGHVYYDTDQDYLDFYLLSDEFYILGSVNGGSEFSILLGNPFVETPPWLKLKACLEASLASPKT